MEFKELIITLVSYGIGGGLAAGTLAFFAGYFIRKAVDIFRSITNV